jgi:hypothetical protein
VDPFSVAVLNQFVSALVQDYGLPVTFQVGTPPPTVDLQPLLDGIGQLRDQGEKILAAIAHPAETAGGEKLGHAIHALRQGWPDDAFRDARGSVELYRYRATAWLVGGLAALALPGPEQGTVAAEWLRNAVRYSRGGEAGAGVAAALIGAALCDAAGVPAAAIALLEEADQAVGGRCPEIVIALDHRLQHASRELTERLIDLWWDDRRNAAEKAIYFGNPAVKSYVQRWRKRQDLVKSAEELGARGIAAALAIPDEKCSLKVKNALNGHGDMPFQLAVLGYKADHWLGDTVNGLGRERLAAALDDETRDWLARARKHAVEHERTDDLGRQFLPSMVTVEEFEVIAEGVGAAGYLIQRLTALTGKVPPPLRIQAKIEIRRFERFQQAWREAHLDKTLATRKALYDMVPVRNFGQIVGAPAALPLVLGLSGSQLVVPDPGHLRLRRNRIETIALPPAERLYWHELSPGARSWRS